jgi:hypothetical protein
MKQQPQQQRLQEQPIAAVSRQDVWQLLPHFTTVAYKPSQPGPPSADADLAAVKGLSRMYMQAIEGAAVSVSCCRGGSSSDYIIW